MAKSSIEIQIPRAKNNEVVDIPSGSILGDISKKIDQFGYLLIAIVASVIISGIAVVIAVVGIFIDQMRYNNAAYSDYSQQVKSNTSIQKEYDNKIDLMLKNQQIIMDKSK